MLSSFPLVAQMILTSADPPPPIQKWLTLHSRSHHHRCRSNNPASQLPVTEECLLQSVILLSLLFPCTPVPSLFLSFRASCGARQPTRAQERATDSHTLPTHHQQRPLPFPSLACPCLAANPHSSLIFTLSLSLTYPLHLSNSPFPRASSI